MDLCLSFLTTLIIKSRYSSQTGAAIVAIFQGQRWKFKTWGEVFDFKIFTTVPFSASTPSTYTREEGDKGQLAISRIFQIEAERGILNSFYLSREEEQQYKS